jgi:hypothetical protein
MVSLERGMTYYTTVRGITNDGSIIQVESDGVRARYVSLKRPLKK